MTILSAWCQNCSCAYQYDDRTMEQIEPATVSDHCSDVTCGCHVKGIPTVTKEELLAKLAQGITVYRHNNIWGGYEFLNDSGYWDEVPASELVEDLLLTMELRGYQYFDDTVAYCD